MSLSARKTHIDALAISLLLACCMFWGFQQVLVKATVAEVAPVFQAFVRFALATVAVAAWCLWRGVRLSAAATPSATPARLCSKGRCMAPGRRQPPHPGCCRTTMTHQIRNWMV